MKKKFIYILLFAVAGCFTSCMKNFDEINPNHVDSSSFWRSLADTDRGLTAVYSTLYDSDLLSIEDFIYCSDLCYPGKRSTSSTGDKQDLYNHVYTSSTNIVEDKWAALYKGIFRANQVIEALNRLEAEGVQYDQKDWESQMAQARLFRGLFHMYLHSTYNQGNIPIFDFVPVENKEFTQPLTRSQDVMKFFRKDLSYAVDVLKVNEPDRKGEVCWEFAQAMIGTSYLYEATEPVYDASIVIDRNACLDSAMVKFNDVILTSKTKRLFEAGEVRNMFTSAGEYGVENLFEVSYSLLYHTELPPFSEMRPVNDLGNASTNSSSGFGLSAWLADIYQQEKLNLYDQRNYGQNEFYPEDLPQSTTLRAGQMVMTSQDDWQSFYSFATTSEKLSVSVSSMCGFFRKYCNWDNKYIDSENDVSGTSDKVSGKSVILMRMADVYLMLAECHIYKGNINDALYLMNTIRNRWGVQLLGTRELVNSLVPADNAKFGPINYAGKSESEPIGVVKDQFGNYPVEYDKDQNGTLDYYEVFNGVTYTQASLLKQLQEYDRPLELSGEGHATRFIDLRRWAITADRFAELSSRVYYFSEGTRRVNNWAYDIETNSLKLNDDGEKVRSDKYVNYLETEESFENNKEFYMQEGTLTNNTNLDNYKITVDYDQAARNYPRLFSINYGYWPVPLNEQETNAYWNVFKDELESSDDSDSDVDDNQDSQE